MAQRPTIKLVNIEKSSEGKLFETEMYTHLYDIQKAKGKMVGWIPKDSIDSITTETVEDANEDEVIIEQLNDSETTDIDIELMDLDELKKFAKDNKVKFHPASKEVGLRKKLKEAGY